MLRLKKFRLDLRYQMIGMLKMFNYLGIMKV